MERLAVLLKAYFFENDNDNSPSRVKGLGVVEIDYPYKLINRRNLWISEERLRLKKVRLAM